MKFKLNNQRMFLIFAFNVLVALSLQAAPPERYNPMTPTVGTETPLFPDTPMGFITSDNLQNRGVCDSGLLFLSEMQRRSSNSLGDSIINIPDSSNTSPTAPSNFRLLSPSSPNSNEPVQDSYFYKIWSNKYIQGFLALDSFLASSFAFYDVYQEIHHSNLSWYNMFFKENFYIGLFQAGIGLGYIPQFRNMISSLFLKVATSMIGKTLLPILASKFLWGFIPALIIFQTLSIVSDAGFLPNWFKYITVPLSGLSLLGAQAKYLHWYYQYLTTKKKPTLQLIALLLQMWGPVGAYFSFTASGGVNWQALLRYSANVLHGFMVQGLMENIESKFSTFHYCSQFALGPIMNLLRIFNGISGAVLFNVDALVADYAQGSNYILGTSSWQEMFGHMFVIGALGTVRQLFDQSFNHLAKRSLYGGWISASLILTYNAWIKVPIFSNLFPYSVGKTGELFSTSFSSCPSNMMSGGYLMVWKYLNGCYQTKSE